MIDFGFVKERDAKADFDGIAAELKRKFGLETLWRPHQIHSDTVFVDGEGDGDGIIITKPSIAVVRTADCVPVVLFDKAADIAGVFHSGWRGTELKIVSKGLKMMKDLGCGNISAVIFPAIGFCCFEIGGELEERFEKAGIPVERRGGRLYADLKAAIKNELETAGITDISDKSECTFCGSGYFSYRKNKTEKRHATFAALRK
ncbi:polyphenol oxidase family protein [bacterium]|nr:polyphenol oxidase family protein [bacterium]